MFTVRCQGTAGTTKQNGYTPIALFPSFFPFSFGCGGGGLANRGLKNFLKKKQAYGKKLTLCILSCSRTCYHYHYRSVGLWVMG